MIWFDIPASVKSYVGRSSEMELIEEYWRQSILSTDLFFVTITGLGGIGKSEVAKNYSQKLKQGNKSNCIWINGDNIQSVTESFTNLAIKLGIYMKDADEFEKDLQTITTEVYEKLFNTNVPTLFIFDNVESYNEPFLHSLIEFNNDKKNTSDNDGSKFFVLITSRVVPCDKTCKTNSIRNIALDVLTAEDATKLIQVELGVPENCSDANIYTAIDSLCERMNYFPLALRQAAAYMKEKSSNIPIDLDIQNYLNLLDKESKKLLNFPSADNQEKHFSQTTYLTWKITLEKMVSKYLPTKELIPAVMNVISVCFPDNISIDFLMKILKNSDNFKDHELLSENSINSTKIRIFELLRNYSMCKWNPELETIYIHRLVQDVTRIDLEENEIWEETIQLCMTSIEKMLLCNEVSSSQMIHVVTLWNHAKKRSNDFIKFNKDFPNLVCQKYDNEGRFFDVFKFAEDALQHFQTALGENDRATLRMIYWKSDSMYERGEFTNALKSFQELHAKQSKLFGENDAYTLDSGNSIGKAFKKLGRNEEAMSWFTNTLKLRKEYFGENHRDTLVLKNNVAIILTSQKKYTEALELLQEVLAAKIQKFGYEHSDTLITQRNIGIVKYEENKLEDAAEIFENILPIEQRVRVADHPLTLVTQHWKALTLKRLGRYSESLHIFTHVFEKRTKSLGSNHPSTVESLNQIHEINSICTK